jgi:hypothetical protein
LRRGHRNFLLRSDHDDDAEVRVAPSAGGFVE